MGMEEWPQVVNDNKELVLLCHGLKGDKTERNSFNALVEQAKIMLNIIEKYENSNTILEHFEFYDIRQANYEKNMQIQQQQREMEP